MSGPPVAVQAQIDADTAGNETKEDTSVSDPVLYVPIGTTVLSLAFTAAILQRYRQSPRSLHLLAWSLGMFTFAVGTFTEGFTALFGWHEPIFRAWYISGALLGGAPLATGTVYLLLGRRKAHVLATLLLVYVIVASTFVLMSPVDNPKGEDAGLSGEVLSWSWVRAFSPLANTYAVIFLIGGAMYSARLWRKRGGAPNRVVGNTLIAIGAILPGIGGSFTRAGYTEVLYVTELLGVLVIYAGYRFNIKGRPVPTGATDGTLAQMPAPAGHESFASP